MAKAGYRYKGQCSDCRVWSDVVEVEPQLGMSDYWWKDDEDGCPKCGYKGDISVVKEYRKYKG
jgi:hypothetical protein